MRALLRLACLGLLGLVPAAANADVWFVTVAGLGGEPDYEQRFAGAAADLERALKGASGTHVSTLSGPGATRDAVRDALREVAAKAGHDDVFVLTLIGHGSWDGVEYRFNLPGPDLDAGEIAALCGRIAARQLLVVATSAGGGAIPALQARGRAVVAATKSGSEKNATVFARYWAEAFMDPAADTDKNQQLSALEAFQYAAAKTADFYTQQKRLATEHAVFVEGEGQPVRTGTPSGDTGRLLASFTLLRGGGERAGSEDPARRTLLTRKEQLEQKIDLLKFQRAAMAPEEYRSQLTQALVELAKVQGELDK